MARLRLLSPSGWPLLAADAITIVTAALARLSLGDLFRIYWIELLSLGVIGVLQIAFARRPGALAKSRGYQGIFFGAHYGTFCVMYYALLPWLLGPRWVVSPNFWWMIGPAIVLGAAHIVEFRQDYLPREAALVSSIQANLIPYSRALPVQIPLLLVALFVPSNIATGWLAPLFALGKTIADLIVVRAREPGR